MKEPATAAAGETANRVDARDAATTFLSYSRTDEAFAGKLSDALTTQGVKVFRDTQDILPAEEWKGRLGQLIAGANSVTFLVSARSIGSEVCLWELEQATSLGKRIVPLVVEDVPIPDLPPLISRLNLTKLAHDGDPDTAAAALAGIIRTDIGWVREHTRLLGLALRWTEAGRPARLLLRSQEIDAAERWREARPAGGPAIPADLSDFIAASRRAAVRRQRGLVAVSLAVSAVTAILSVLAWLNAEEADRQREVAEAQTRAAELRLADNMVIQGNSLRRSDDIAAKRQFSQARVIYGRQDAGTTAADLGWIDAAGRSPDPLRRLVGTGGAVTALAASADGGMIVAGDDKGQVSAWREGRDEPAFSASVGSPVLVVALPEAGDLLVAGRDGAVSAVPPDGGPVRPVATVNASHGAVVAAAPSRDRKAVAIVQYQAVGEGHESRVSLVHSDGQVTAGHHSLTLQATSIAAGQTPTEFVVGGVDGSSVVDFADPDFFIASLNGAVDVHPLMFAFAVDHLAVDPATRRAVTAGSDGIIEVYAIERQRLAAVKAALVAGDDDKARELDQALNLNAIRTFSGGVASLSAVDLAAPSDGMAALAGFANGRLMVLEGGSDVYGWSMSVSDSAAPVTASASYLEGGSDWRTGLRVVAGDAEGRVAVYAPFDPPNYMDRVGGLDMMTIVDFADDGRRYLASGPIMGGYLHLVDLGATAPARSLKLASPLALSAARLGPGADEVWVGGEGGALTLTNLRDGATLTTLRASGPEIYALAVSDGRTKLAVLDESARISVFEDGKETRRMEYGLPLDGNPALDLSSDGDRLLAVSGSGIQFFDVARQRLLWRLDAEEGRSFDGASLSADGSSFALSDGGRISVWSTDGPKRIWDTVGSGSNAAVIFGHRDSTVISGGRDGTLGVLSAIDGQVLFERRDLPPIVGLAISPEGAVAASVTGDRQVYGDVDVIVLRADLAAEAAAGRPASAAP